MMHRVMLAGVVGLLALNAAVFLAGAWVLTWFPFQLDYGEGLALWHTDRVLRLGEAYHSLHQYPYIIFPYPPLYHLLVRLCQMAVHDPLGAGRVVAWVSALGGALLVGLIVKVGTEGRTRRGVVAAVMASLLVFHLPSIGWVPNMRVDMTALCFSLLGLFVFLRFPGVRGCAVASVVFVAAVFTKQPMIAAPTAVLGVLLLARRFREAVTMVIVVGVLGGGLAGLLTVVTGGEFLRHTVVYNANSFHVTQLLLLMKKNLLGMNVLAGLALTLPLTVLATRRYRAMTDGRGVGTTLLAAVFYLLAAFGISLSAGKRGASYNYFLEWNVACCIVDGLLLGRILGRNRGWHRSVAATAIVLIVGSVGFSHLDTTIWYWHIVTGRDPGLNELAADAGRALDLMRATPGRVFSDDLTLLAKAGKEVPWEPSAATMLAAAGVWDERPALKMIKTRQFDLIVVQALDGPLLFSPMIRAAIHDAYVDAGVRTGHYVILRRREADSGRLDARRAPSE